MGRPDREPSPPPWRRRTSTTDRIEFERSIDADGEYVRLLARRTGRSCPPGSGAPGWTIELERRSREVSSKRSIGHVTTRSRAVRSLVEAMRTVNDVLAEDADGNGRGGHGTLVERLRGQTRRSARGSARGDGRRRGTGDGA